MQTYQELINEYIARDVTLALSEDDPVIAGDARLVLEEAGKLF